MLQAGAQNLPEDSVEWRGSRVECCRCNSREFKVSGPSLDTRPQNTVDYPRGFKGKGEQHLARAGEPRERRRRQPKAIRRLSGVPKSWPSTPLSSTGTRTWNGHRSYDLFASVFFLFVSSSIILQRYSLLLPTISFSRISFAVLTPLWRLL